MSMGGSTGQIWLDCDPHQRVPGGGWPAGGWSTVHEFAPYAEITWTLIVENRGKDPLYDMRIALCIHSEDPPTTTDDFEWIDIAGSTHYLPDFGSTEYNPFDEWFGGRHQVYVGTDAIWDIYFHAPDVVPAKSTLYLPVTVKLGGNPSDLFEIHFDAFDPVTEYKTPNGHDVTFLSGARLPQDKEPPVPIIDGGAAERWVNEGDLVVFDGSNSYDPDGNIVSYEWDFDAEVDSDGDGITENDVDETGPIVEFTWYDDYEVDVSLTVTDNDGLFATAYQHVYVLNVDPTIEFEGAFIEFELSLRVAGEKWHNVELLVVKNYDPINETWDDEVGVLEVERWPGPPDENPTSGDTNSILVSVDITGQNTYTAILTYDPYPDEGDAIMGDQDINGQLWGGNPVWLIATFPDGTVCKKHHTFNVQQSIKRDSDHWNHVEPWIVDLTVGAVPGVPIKFVATATDPGSDDLNFTWDWGDSTSDLITYLYDPVRGFDPGFPPGSPYEPLGAPWDPWYVSYLGTLPPLSVTDITYHTYGAEGVYTVTLTVTDDDGGTDTYTVDIDVHGEFGGC
jgi:chitodextrinase